MTDEQSAEALAIVWMAAEPNTLANSMQIPVDREFEVR